MAFVIQAHIEDHTLSATTETAKEAFAKAIEWQGVHKFSDVTISNVVRSFTIAEFALAMASLGIENVLDAESGRGPPKVPELAGLTRYTEWMSRGRRTNRQAYVLKEWELPMPKPGAEWHLDKSFNLAEELLRFPEIKIVLKVVIEKGFEIFS